MKRNFLTFAAAILMVGLCGSCSKSDNGRLDDLSKKTDNLEAMIKNVTIIPSYTDGGVEVAADSSMLLNLIIEPASVVSGIETSNTDLFTVYMTKVKTKTKAADGTEILSKDKLTITNVNKETGVVSLKADVSDYAKSDYSYSVAVNVKIKHNDSFSSTFTSDFVNVNLPHKVCVLWENEDPENNLVKSWSNDFIFVLKDSPADKKDSTGQNTYLKAFDANQWAALKKCLYAEIKTTDTTEVKVANTWWSWCYGGQKWKSENYLQVIEEAKNKCQLVLDIEKDGNLLRDPKSNIDEVGMLFTGKGYTLLRLYYIR